MEIFSVSVLNLNQMDKLSENQTLNTKLPIFVYSNTTAIGLYVTGFLHNPEVCLSNRTLSYLPCPNLHGKCQQNTRSKRMESKLGETQNKDQ